MLSPICSDKPAMARKVRQRIDLIRRWAMAYEYRRDNPADEARNGMIRVTPSRATPHDGLASVIAGVHASGASWAITLAFEFLVLAVARPGEVRLAQWGEIDLETATRRKGGPSGSCTGCWSSGTACLSPLVPLMCCARCSHSTVVRTQGLIFVGNTGRTIDPSAMSKLLRELRAPCVPNGVRSSFRDWCGETGIDRTLVELSLAPKVRRWNASVLPLPV